MHIVIRFWHIAFLAVTMLAWQTNSAAAQTASPQMQTEPPTGTISSAQPWWFHQDWFCPPNSRLNPTTFVLKMRDTMNQRGNIGWEMVGFTPASIAGVSCFVATYKLPRSK